MQRSNVSLPGEEYRQLRAITTLIFPIGFSLLLPYGLVSEEVLPALGIAPMFFSAAFGSVMYFDILRDPKQKAVIDLAMSLLYFVILVPSWHALAHFDYQGIRLTMLGTYGSATMMLNLCEYLPICGCPGLILTVTSAIHLFLSIRAASLIELPTITWQLGACPECEHHHHNRILSIAGHQVSSDDTGWDHRHKHGVDGAQQPFINAYDTDSRESSEYQTSGFNSPRRSAETLGTLNTDLGDITDRLE